MARETIFVDDKEYTSCEAIAPQVGLTAGRLREMARGYDKRKNRPAAPLVPCHKLGRLYYFNLYDLQVALGIRPKQAPVARETLLHSKPKVDPYLAGL